MATAEVVTVVLLAEVVRAVVIAAEAGTQVEKITNKFLQKIAIIRKINDVKIFIVYKMHLRAYLCHNILNIS